MDSKLCNSAFQIALSEYAPLHGNYRLAHRLWLTSFCKVNYFNTLPLCPASLNVASSYYVGLSHSIVPVSVGSVTME